MLSEHNNNLLSPTPEKHPSTHRKTPLPVSVEIILDNSTRCNPSVVSFLGRENKAGKCLCLSQQVLRFQDLATEIKIQIRFFRVSQNTETSYASGFHLQRAKTLPATNPSICSYTLDHLKLIVWLSEEETADCINSPCFHP